MHRRRRSNGGLGRGVINAEAPSDLNVRREPQSLRQSAPTAAEGFSPCASVDKVDHTANDGERKQDLGDEQDRRDHDLPDQNGGDDHPDDLQQILV